MARVKRGTTNRARHKKVLKLAKGFFGSKHRLYRTAHEQVMHSLKYAYRDRRQKKRDFRKLWITRINAACRLSNVSYSRFINGLSVAGIEVNRKMLSEIAIDNPKAFADLVEVSKQALSGTLAKEKEVKAEVVAKTEKVIAKKEAVVAKTEKVIAKKEVKAEDLTGLTVADLRELAKKKEITGFSTMKKAELIDALK